MSESTSRRRRAAWRFPAGVPADARYVNVTTLDEDLVRRTCRHTVSRPMVILYRVVGGVMVAVGLAYFFLLHGDVAPSLLIALLGAIFLHQQARFAEDATRRTMREIEGVDKGELERTYYFTESEMGAVMDDGSTRTFPYAAVTQVCEDGRAFVIVLDRRAGAITIDRDGFRHGSAEDFAAQLRTWAEAAGAHLRA